DTPVTHQPTEAAGAGWTGCCGLLSWCPAPEMLFPPSVMVQEEERGWMATNAVRRRQGQGCSCAVSPPGCRGMGTFSEYVKPRCMWGCMNLQMNCKPILKWTFVR
uniref:Uncharacterized protein n=1 Tax=Fundulus heteroclitus TaxID=8078 RepID=A0A3Q2UM83_FUNHE